VKQKVSWRKAKARTGTITPKGEKNMPWLSHVYSEIDVPLLVGMK
jgi:hypothetical protein